MCRMYALRATQPTKVECALIHAQNALLIQSQGDSRGMTHNDGWGVSCHTDGIPDVIKRERPAHRDLHFSSTVESVFARTVVAHVRRATVGEVSYPNTQPFSYGPWVFSHNGTVTGFHKLEARLRRETASRLLQLRGGTADSELAFYWLLTRMANAGVVIEKSCTDLEGLTAIVASVVRDLAGLCRRADPEKRERLNFMITDGYVLVATRWNNSLFWVHREGVRDCEICGIPHVETSSGGPYRAAVLASEPISQEEWRAVPEAHCVSVDRRASLLIQPV